MNLGLCALGRILEPFYLRANAQCTWKESQVMYTAKLIIVQNLLRLCHVNNIIRGQNN